MSSHKKMTLVDVFSTATGAMISSGIFLLPVFGYAKIGPAVVLSYIVAGLLAFLGVLSISELATAMPKEGGDYYFIKRSLGGYAGTVSGLFSWFAISLKSAFGIFGMVSVLKLFTNITNNYILQEIGIVIAIIFVLLNIYGVKESHKFQTVLVFSLLCVMGSYIFFGFHHFELDHLEPFITNHRGALTILGVAGLDFVAYGGIIKVIFMSGDICNPKRNIPLGLITSILVTMFFYAAMIFITVGVEEPSYLADHHNLTPIAHAARYFMGDLGVYLILFLSLLAFISTAFAGIKVASRYPVAMGRDDLIPDAVGYLSTKHKTPLVALLFTGALICVALLLPLELLIESASTVVIVTYILSHLSVIVLRESKIQNYKPSFKSPLYPAVQIIGILVMVFLIFKMGLYPILITSGLMIISLLVYLVYGRRIESKEFALLHLVERLVNKKLTSNNLEDELKHIIFERDEIVRDKFDHMIDAAKVIDLKHETSLDGLFKVISRELDKCMSFSQEEIIESLHERERQSSCALTHFVAIPHLIIDKDKGFQIILIRAKKGIYFSEELPKVKAIFVLAGCMSERNLHLKSLSAIAQIVQDDDFENKWNRARQTSQLRDIILLGERKRFH